MESTPVTRRASSTAAAQMQAVLRSSSLHPPPAGSLDTVASSTALSVAGSSVVAPELMAVSTSPNLELAILCEDNTIRAVSLLDLPDTPSKTTPHNRRSARDEDVFHKVSFAADCALRPGDDAIPSDSIPAKTFIKGLEFSPSGHSLLIWGENYVAVARLPRSTAVTRGSGGGRDPSSANRNGNNDRRALTAAASSPSSWDAASRREDPGVRWRWTLVDMSGYAVDVLRQRVVQAAWNPASDSCVTLLTAAKDEGGVGARARSFVMLHVPGRQRPEQVLPIADGPSMSLPVAISHGRGAGWQRFAVWLARRDGSVGVLCPVVPKNAKVDADELLELWSATCDKVVAARWERSTNGGGNQKTLDEEVAYLEQQQSWLRETFGDIFDDNGVPDASRPVPQPTNAGATQGRRAWEGTGAGALVTRRHLVLQDDVVVGRGTRNSGNSASGHSGGAPDSRGKTDERRGEDAGPACGLVVLAGAGDGGDAREAAAAPPPAVLAVAYGAGCVDIAMVPAGVTPRWAERSGTRTSCTAGTSTFGACAGGAVLESLQLAERSSDRSSRRRQGLALSIGAGAWTLLAATPCRLASITVAWAARMEKMAGYARERAAHGRSENTSGRLDGDLRASLRERPDSSVAEVLFVPPNSPTGRIVGVVPIASPIVGHLAMARLASGMVEMINLAIVTLQATEVASAAKRALAQETPGRGDMLPPFEAMVQKALDALEERRLGETLGSSAGHLLMSELDRQGVHLLEEEADRLVEGGVIVLEKLNLKTSTRLQTLREVYEHQAGLVGGMSKDIRRLRSGQEGAEERLEEICRMADEQRARSAGVLAVMQVTRPDISPAERAFMAEMKDMENYADRQQVIMEPAAKQVEELRMAEAEAEEFLFREAQGLGVGSGRTGAGTGLSERETKDAWNMLQADRERILGLHRRLEAARTRLGELGVRQEE